MKTLVAILTIVAMGTSVSAQHLIESIRNKKSLHQSFNSKQKPNYLKAGSLVKPLAGKDYGNPDPINSNYQDSSSFTRTYNTQGKITTEIHTDLATGELSYKIENGYDSKGHIDFARVYAWDSVAFTLVNEYGLRKTYDMQDRLITVADYSMNGADTTYANYWTVNYVPDSAIMSIYNPASTAPNGIDAVYKAYKVGVSAVFNTLGIKEWGAASAYNTGVLTKIDWNGVFEFERLLGVIEYDLLFDYAEYSFTEDGITEEGRIIGSFSPSLDVEDGEIKTGLLYVPDSRQSISKNQKGDVVLISYEYSYNALTQQFANYDNYKTDYTYQQENITKEVYSQSSTTSPAYADYAEIHYMDFQDVSGIATINQASAINIFPNPAHASLHFEVVGTIESLLVTDMLGKEIICPFATQGTLTTADVSGLKTGFYVITVLADGKLSRQVVEVVR